MFISVVFYLFTTLIQRKTSIKKSLISDIAGFILFVFSIILTNPRGIGGAQASTFIIISILIFSFAISKAIFDTNSETTILASLVFLAFMFIPLNALISTSVSVVDNIKKNDFNKYQVQFKPVNYPEINFIKENTVYKNDFLVLVLRPILYIHTDRIPASGNYYYLPWQARYNKHPIFNTKIDINSDLIKNKPSIIYCDKWKVWDLYDFPDYAGEVTNILNNNYVKMDDYQYLYVRKDVYKKILENTSFIKNEEKNTVYGEILPGNYFDETFIPLTKHIVEVKLLLATYTHKCTGYLSLKLMKNNHVLAEEIQDLASIGDSAWDDFNINVDNLDTNAKYTLRLTTIGTTNNQTITWWAKKSDVIKACDAFINGNKIDADFCFKIRMIK
jgi:hypothetical protein